ncbi:hypothetical protein K1T71_006300 [Dendrolimus kikuchii]|uniref:Uncharacterized protein n=1 Tax=Dendrolimus kikuchii TaxID=765133 RepID=A0ACC1D4Z4_9NEOP|nr:hypothetical protein K1T71_006300 [Dendrolimus kikuchii]
MSFTGFSEEDLQRIKSGESVTPKGPQINTTNVKRINKIAAKPVKVTFKYKSPVLQQQNSEDAIDDMQFDKCKLSIKTSTTSVNSNNEDDKFNENREQIIEKQQKCNDDEKKQMTEIENNDLNEIKELDENNKKDRRDSVVITPDIVRGVENYTENDVSHNAKLEELQLKQKMMEEQNKKRKEMLAKALADRTKQTAEEVMRLEKIKKELQVLDSQFSQDVAVLRKKIDHACLSYAEAEKHYLKVEKEFLQAKINLQKEREKKELLTEHLCALITHNETRKAQKLENLMLELAAEKKNDIPEVTLPAELSVDDEKPVIIDGVDQNTGKIVVFPET